MQMNELWRERVRTFVDEIQRYLKYMLNDHFVFVMIFGGGAGIYYYSEWVKTLDENFPVAILMAAIVALTVAISPVITLLKEADIVYLLPLEKRLTAYFNKGIRLSIWTQSYLILIVLAIFMPMYSKVTGNGFKQFILFLIIAFALKIWNTNMHWKALKLQDEYTPIVDVLVRYSLSAVMMYFIISEAHMVYVMITLVIFIAFTLYLYSKTKDHPLQWERLIRNEQRRMQKFYTVANLFTDVPHLKDEVKRRKWLDWLYNRIPFTSDSSYRFLFARTLVRTKEFSGLVLRLTLLGMFILLLNGNLYFSIAISIVFIYLTGFQFIPMLKKHSFLIWPSIYPISEKQKETAFLQLVRKILFTQSILFAIIVFISGGMMNGAIILGITIVFSFVFHRFYLPARISKIF